MPDTGAPWNIPYVAGTDLVSDWPTDSQTIAEAVADGLDGAFSLVDVKSVVLTSVFSASVTAGASTLVTGLTIDHACADAANKVVLFTSCPGANSDNGYHNIALNAGGTLLNLGDAASNRTRVATAIQTAGVSTSALSLMAVHSPASTSTITYGVSAINVSNSTRTVYVNRGLDDGDFTTRPRTSSILVLMEVTV